MKKVWPLALGAALFGTAMHCGGSENTVPDTGNPVDAGTDSPASDPLGGKVKVSFDKYDVPTLHCGSHVDCYQALGYYHARDRFFQMDLLRRQAEGRLTEMVGALELSTDQFYRTVFTTMDGKRIEEALFTALDSDPESKAVFSAYADGVNTYLAEVKAGKSPMPPEYQHLLYPIAATDLDTWRVQDSLAIARLQQFDLSESMEDELAWGRFYATFAAGATPNLGKIDAYVRARQPVPSYTIPQGAGTSAPVGKAPSLTAGDARALASRLSPLAGAIPAKPASSPRVIDFLRPALGDFGSNNWAVDAAHSANGKAMVANDPHLPLSYPSIFYLTHLQADDNGLNVQGGTFAGLPTILSGRGAHVGWGVTVVLYDVTDLYLETVNADGTVNYKGNKEPLRASVEETFKVRDSGGLNPASSKKMTIQVTRHGPILPADLPGGISLPQPIAMHWTGQEVTNDTRAFLGLANAKDVDDAVAQLRAYKVGAQNFMLADDKGNIAYDPHANVPDRTAWAKPSLPPWAPLPGDCSDGKGGYLDVCPEWGDGGAHQYLTDDKLPYAKNPATGFMATANADPVGVTDDNDPTNNTSTAGPAYPYLSFDFDDGTAYRHARINERLAELTAGGGKVSRDDMASIQSDHVLRFAQDFLPLILPSIVSARADLKTYTDLLTQWSAPATGGHIPYNCPSGMTGPVTTAAAAAPDVVLDSAACYLFHATMRRFLPGVFMDEFTGQGIYESVRAIKSLKYILTTPAADQSFCDDVTTAAKTETCADIAVAAFAAAVQGVSKATQSPDVTTWLWGKAHTLKMDSLASPLLSTGFESGEYARGGGWFTVDVGSPSPFSTSPNDHDADFGYGHGASIRHIDVMDGVTAMHVALPGVERDGIFEQSNLSLVNEYVVNAYHEFATTPSDVAAQATSSADFTPVRKP